MSEVGSYPNATSPLDGTERILADQGGITKNLTPAQILQAQAIGTLGMHSLSLRTTFSPNIANAPLVENYQFGTSAASGPGITPVRNLVDLALYFNPFEDFTGTTTINSELQRYQLFNANNHQFLSDRLQLTALNPNSDWNCTNITQIAGTVNLNNTATGIGPLGLPNTSGLQVGQVACVAHSGVYLVTAIVANVSVTLQELGGSTTTAQTSGLIFWMPVVSSVLAADYVPGTTVFSVVALPTSTNINGYQLAHYNSGANIVIERNADYRVTTASGTTVNFNQQWTVGGLAAGQRIFFLPVITSGQIWSKAQFDLTNPDSFFAIEYHIDNYGGSRHVSTLNANTLALFNALPADVPWGGWATAWVYSADDGSANAETGSAAEIDVLEPMISLTQGTQQANTGNSTAVPTSPVVFIKTDSGWTNFFGSFIHGKNDGTDFAGDHFWQMIYCNGRTYKFFDEVLIQVQTFQWLGQHPLQFAMDLACGSFQAGLGGNILVPNATTNFAGVISGIKGIKVWYQKAANG
jgi:hypothetical protein